MVDLMGKRFYFFGLSLLILIAGVVGLVVHDGFNLDIQFKGGTMITMQMTAQSIEKAKADEFNVDTQKAQELILKNHKLNSNAQKSIAADPKDNSKAFVYMELNIPSTGEESNKDIIQKIEQDIIKEFKLDPKTAVAQEDDVAPFIGRELLRNGLMAVAVASLLIIGYIWIRFKVMSGLSAGIFAIIALLHDVMIMITVYTVFNIPLNESFIAAVLTIYGYSMNDTIIIYDRIRENSHLLKRIPIAELVNTSIIQTLARSINTVLTVLICLITAYVFSVVYNINSIREFTLPLIIGVASGCYSSIFVASPLWYMWKERQQKKRITAKQEAKA